MYRITTFFLLATLLCAQGAAVLSAEANEDDQLLTDIRLFTVLTAINVLPIGCELPLLLVSGLHSSIPLDTAGIWVAFFCKIMPAR